jgi:hypothetical protein
MKGMVLKNSYHMQLLESAGGFVTLVGTGGLFAATCCCWNWLVSALVDVSYHMQLLVSAGGFIASVNTGGLFAATCCCWNPHRLSRHWCSVSTNMLLVESSHRSASSLDVSNYILLLILMFVSALVGY